MLKSLPTKHRRWSTTQIAMWFIWHNGAFAVYVLIVLECISAKCVYYPIYKHFPPCNYSIQYIYTHWHTDTHTHVHMHSGVSRLERLEGPRQCKGSVCSLAQQPQERKVSWVGGAQAPLGPAVDTPLQMHIHMLIQTDTYIKIYTY